MKYRQLIATAICIAISACNSTTMVESRYDTSSNQYSSKVYSKYYDDGGWLIPDHLGSSVVADHMKKRIPVIHGIQQFLGALGPSDSDAQAKITVYLWNFDNSTHAMTNIQLSTAGQAMRASTDSIKVLPKTRTQVDLGVIHVFDSGKEIPVTVSYTVDGRRIRQSLTLMRRTTDDLKSFYSPQGRLPYPWHARASELKY